MPKPLIAIVGRPNVGKSTVFNRIVGERRAVVSDIPGTTRDRLIAEAEWEGHTFLIVDTGGIEILPPNMAMGKTPLFEDVLSEDSAAFIPLIRAQAEIAIHEADLIIFLLDVRTGLTSADREVADLLRKTHKPIMVVANKVDNDNFENDAFDFYELGMGEVHTISAIHGAGVADLLDEIVERFIWEEIEDTPDDTVRMAIVGRPNVGKSSLLNAILGEERSIVSPVAGTTRDAIDTEIEWDGQKIVLVDTAGIRRRGKIGTGVEKWSVLRSARALTRADIALLLIDATEGVTAQDAHIAGMILEEGVSVIVVINKWDLVTPEVRKDRQQFTDQLLYDLKFLNYVPLVFTSALTGYHVTEVLPAALKVVEARYQRLPTSDVSDIISEALMKQAPPSTNGRRLRVYFSTQSDVAPPTFLLYVNDPELVHFSYQRYLENRIREVFQFPGTPIKFIFRGHKSDKETGTGR